MPFWSEQLVPLVYMLQLASLVELASGAWCGLKASIAFTLSSIEKRGKLPPIRETR